MNEIPDFILLVIFIGIVVALVILRDFVKRRKKKKKREIQKKPLKEVSMEGKTLHRCPNKECNKLFENPAKEITYVTDPPTEKLVCPKCYTPLKILVKGELKIRPVIEVAVNKYTLTVVPEKMNVLMTMLEKNNIIPKVFAEGGKIFLQIETERKIKCQKLKESGFIEEFEVG